jgi:hypothetical protein
MKILTILLSSLLLTSCHLLPIKDLTIDQKAVLVKSLSRTSTVLAINSLNEYVDKQISAAHAIKCGVSGYALPFLAEELLVRDFTLESLLLNSIDVEYATLLQSAIDLFYIYYNPPDVDQFLDEDSRKLLVAFFEGVVEGCDLTLKANE